MTINDAITKILFKINYDKITIFLEIISLFRNHLEQHKKITSFAIYFSKHSVMFYE